MAFDNLSVILAVVTDKDWPSRVSPTSGHSGGRGRVSGRRTWESALVGNDARQRAAFDDERACNSPRVTWVVANARQTVDEREGGGEATNC